MGARKLLLLFGIIIARIYKLFVYKVSKKHKYEPHYLILPQGKIGFGMNGLQNEELTFEIAAKDDIFFHVKDYPGSHVVLLEGKDNQDMKTLACELCLYLSHLDNGTIMIAKRKDVKKNPNKIGLVNILKYETLVVKFIREESLSLFKKALKAE
jgi:predicted ribosome quality control (RQC) complex YloA/Tae2 family protein